MGGCRYGRVGNAGLAHGWVERWCRYGSVYIASLRLGGRKLPTYELTLRLLGVATMYGWILWLIHYV